MQTGPPDLHYHLYLPHLPYLSVLRDRLLVGPCQQPDVPLLGKQADLAELL